MSSVRLPRTAKAAALAALKEKPKVRIQPLTATLKASKSSTATTNGITKKSSHVKRSTATQKDIILKQVETAEVLDLPPPVTKTIDLENKSVKEEVVGISYSSGDITDETPPPSSSLRHTNPHTTNVPLSLTSNVSTIEADPTIVVPDPSTPTTINASDFLKKGIEHILSVDADLKPLIDKHFCHVFSVEGFDEVVDPFRSLVSGILSQQVSGAAARAIKNKFIALFDPPIPFPTPQQCVDMPLETMRTAGLSQRKAEYVKALAEKFVSGELSLEILLTGSDEELIEKLVAVRGIGVWSAEMFLCFGLKRGDILSTGDLGVQRGMAIHAGRDVSKLKSAAKGKWKYMKEEEMLERAEKYRPYRSIYMWYMWRIGETDVQAMEV